MDKKVKMHSHDQQITAILFCGEEGNLLASLSGGIRA